MRKHSGRAAIDNVARNRRSLPSVIPAEAEIQNVRCATGSAPLAVAPSVIPAEAGIQNARLWHTIAVVPNDGLKAAPPFVLSAKPRRGGAGRRTNQRPLIRGIFFALMLLTFGMLAACTAPEQVMTPTPTATAAATAPASPTPEPPPTPTPVPSEVPEGGVAIYMEGARFAVDVADTGEERNQGLSGRESMPWDGGMWFDFGREVSTSFWMVDMHFPLDMVWVNRELQVVAVSHNVPAPEPGQTDSELPYYDAGDHTVQYVLEIHAGLADQYGIGSGSVIEIADE